MKTLDNLRVAYTALTALQERRDDPNGCLEEAVSIIEDELEKADHE